MSTVDEDYEVSICANCGKGEEESDKLKACTACKLVKYCNRECQIAHRPQHKKECRRRAAELHDEKLFKQPPPDEDCPICFLRMPTLPSGRRYMICCGKTICSGCFYAPVYDHQGNIVAEKVCPYCRVSVPKSYEEMIEREKERAELNDPIAMLNLGEDYFKGTNGYPQDYVKALELWHRAAEFGNAEAYNRIGYAYGHGQGVEVDKKKADHYFELAAIGGNEVARHNLGCVERNAGNMNRALKHFFIAVRGGQNKSLKIIKELYINGNATKEDYTKALQYYQEYLGEIKSRQRDEAAAADEELRYYY